ncbi:MAG: hypothetical protein ABGX05_13695 [Pirellulaceae bacterium]
MAEQSFLGYVWFNGSWRYPEPDLSRLPRHADHVYRNCNNRQIPARKYCVCPNGRLKFLRWSTHGILSGVRMNRLANILLSSRHVEYWHFRRISTFWKFRRAALPCEKLQLEPTTKQVMAQVFGPGATGV